MSYYCNKHKYNPPKNSGEEFCPYCELTQTTDGIKHGLDYIRSVGYAVNSGVYIEYLDKENAKLCAESDELRAALSAIVEANRNNDEMSQPLEDARRVLEDS